MKYDLEVSLADSNTSHAQVVELVGTGNRVLDVGCSTGALARVLQTRSNTVSGVEIDPEAAKLAEPYLDRVVVGDLESINLLDHFEAGSFDVIVFADVLEHLRDPVAVLRGALPLLTPGGAVVVSLPNIAHGSVRLALLEGRFEYRPLGLLDDTHLRFFTRRSVEELLDAAGLLAVDMRRTTADAFATEIPLSPDHFADDVVARVRSHPDSDTYQFVFRAIPTSGGPHPELAAELVARNEELEALRTQVREVLAAARGYIPPHSVGLVVEEDGGAGRPWSSLRTAVISQELRRRLDGRALVHLRTGADGAPATWRGEPVTAIDPTAEATAELIADAYDAVVTAGGRALGQLTPLIASLAERGCPVYPVAVAGTDVEKLAESVRTGSVRAGARYSLADRGGLSAVPDPLVLADRAVGGDALPLRLQYLRATGQLAVDGDYLLLAAGSVPADQLGALARVAHELASARDCAVVVVPAPADGPAPVDTRRLGDDIDGSAVIDQPSETDLLALISGARLVLTDAGPAAAVAVALQRPLLAFGGSEEIADLASWAGDPDLAASTPAELLSRIGLADERAGDEHLLARLRAPLDLHFDELASAVTGAAARRLALSTTEILRLLQTRVATLEQANQALQMRLVAERNALGHRCAQLNSGDAPGSRRAAQRLQEAEDARAGAEERAAEAERRTEAARAELEAVMSTKTMRILSPGRKLYGRIRHLSQ